MIDQLAALWQPISTVLALLVAVLASAHVVLHKRESRSAAGWVGLIWLVPALGALLYLLLGINRIRRRAAQLREGIERVHNPSSVDPIAPIAVSARVSQAGSHLADLAQLVGRVTERPLLDGNRITQLHDGDETYPAMLEAIDGARSSVALATYIFDTSPVGMRFVEALSRATARGVEVRVLIDDIGRRYAYPTVDRVLKKHGVRVARFMPALFLRAAYLNLRSHRKILVVDGRIGFTGGINIRAGHVIADRPKHPIRDLHFKLEGPVVSQLLDVFVEDWTFSTRERLSGDAWFPRLSPVGKSLARGIADGPDEDLDKVSWTLQGAIACARRSVIVMTPYFLPDSPLVSALSVAALRGVRVDVIVPARVNLRLVQWAMWRHFEDVLGEGVKVWLSPPPFAHQKLMLVDNEWVLFGSANWDARSLRLNFELNVECYDVELARSLRAYAEAHIQKAEALTFERLESRSAFERVRDGMARLFVPYL